MRAVRMVVIGLGTAIPLLPAVSAAAADARHPYSNVDPRYDAGNDTGDSRVESLNAGQLDENFRRPYYYYGRPLPADVRPPRLRRPYPAYGYYDYPPVPVPGY